MWEETKYDADLVISVPDSGNTAAIGYAMASGLPFNHGLIKNRYMGRTFIKPTQKERELAVRMKLNVVKSVVKGKRIVMVDDSIVRGTTSGIICKMLREAGAKEVNMCVSAPPIMYSCYYGIDTSVRKELIASTLTVEEIRKYIGVDRLHFISLDGLCKSIPNIPREDLCLACFNGEYPTETPVANEEGENMLSNNKGLTYRDAGVDIDAGNKAVELMKDSVKSTYRPEVLGDLGGFGGLFSLMNSDIKSLSLSAERTALGRNSAWPL